MHQLSTPSSIDELMQRAKALAGMRLADLADSLKTECPANFNHHKGWLGEMIECYLGADAQSRPEADFTQLGIELKTIPFDLNYKPMESTFVCSIPLLTIRNETWETSTVWKKLKKVLWVPVLADKSIAIPERQVGTPLLLEPASDVVTVLRNDWQMLVDHIVMGQLDQISARHGELLQIRPKAAHGKALVWGINEVGERVQTLPRGFYLRTAYTRAILEQNTN